MRAAQPVDAVILHADAVVVAQELQVGVAEFGTHHLCAVIGRVAVITLLRGQLIFRASPT